jgi:hypothetical protein
MAVRTVSILGGNWAVTTAWTGGVVPIAGDTVDFTALSGNLTVNVGTAALVGINFTNYVNTITINSALNVTSGTINLGTGGYTQLGTNGLVLGGNNTVISNGTVWSRTLTFVGVSSTLTLSDNLYVTGNILFQSASTYNLSGNSLYVGGSLDMSANGILGTTTIIFNGTGTWTNPGAINGIKNNLTIDTLGTLTISGTVYYNTGTLTYIKGTVITTGSSLNISGTTTTLNTNGITWNNVNPAGTITLTSDLYFSGLFANGAASSFVINGSNIYCMSGKLQGLGNGVIFSGTSTFIFKGDSSFFTIYSSFNFTLNTIIDCNTLTLASNNTTQFSSFSTNTLTYIKGKINKGSYLQLLSSCTLINFHKCIIDNIVITSGQTITMNEFFSGSPSRVINIVSSNVNANYIISFQDGFEKISKFVNITNCTLSKPLQLLVITNSPKSSTNTRGIRYINQSPNGIAKGDPSVGNTMTFGAGGLLSDPNMR